MLGSANSRRPFTTAPAPVALHWPQFRGRRLPKKGIASANDASPTSRPYNSNEALVVRELEPIDMKGFIRPEPVVLPSGSLIPAPNLINPPPNHFTHQAQRETPYFYSEAANNKQPDGVIPPGTRVTMLRCEDGGRCRVVDERGLYIQVDSKNLQQL
ncbi:MAG: hypothetical protein ACXW3Z_12495 [Limisphaerales bacterium]